MTNGGAEFSLGIRVRELSKFNFRHIKLKETSGFPVSTSYIICSLKF